MMFEPSASAAAKVISTFIAIAGLINVTLADAVNSTAAPTSQPAAIADASKIAVTFTGGHDTDPRDRGRPVVLVAAGLNVPADVFRKAFTKVKPARPGERPDPDQVRLNKQTLLHDLGPYGVTNDLLDKVSNYYRYVRSRGEMWRNSPAEAYATIDHGAVTAITITKSGSGFSSPPQISIEGATDQSFTAVLDFGTDLSKNGSIAKITIASSATSSP